MLGCTDITLEKMEMLFMSVPVQFTVWAEGFYLWKKENDKPVNILVVLTS